MRRDTMEAFRRYILLQLPGWLLAAVVLYGLWQWAQLSGRLAGGLFVIWIAKDFVFYPLVRRAYESGVRTGAERLIGERGIARQQLAPRGYVLVRGELWHAEVQSGGPPIAAGSPVEVTGAHRLTLVVTPADNAAADWPA